MEDSLINKRVLRTNTALKKNKKISGYNSGEQAIKRCSELFV